MNHHNHKLTHEKAVAAGLTVVLHPATRMYEIERAARALERAAIVLRAVPNFPDCEDLRASYQKHYDECEADMRRALNA